jgi:hypothetical protein
MTRRNARIVAKYLREAGWGEGAIGAATTNGGDYGRPHRGHGSRDYHAEAGAAAKARIQEMGDKDNAFKPFTSWRSRTPTPTICVNAWLHLFAICRERDPVEG